MKNSGAPNPIWIFDSEKSVMSQSIQGGDIFFSGGMLKVVPLGNDPRMNLALKNSFDSEEFPYFAYRYNIRSTVDVTAFFYTTDTGVDLVASHTDIKIIPDGNWQNCIFDMTSKKPLTWTGTITSVRIDPIDAIADLDADIYIDRLGFFRSVEEANEFLATGRSVIDYSEETVFADTLQKAIIPTNTLSAGYKKAQYMLTSTTPEGEGENPVVMRETAQGKKEIVALGYTNKAGFTTFVANKPAKYTLGYNHKVYSDISGHENEQSINFVCDRGLFETQGDKFLADKLMTTGEFISALGRIQCVDTAENSYGDWAVEKGIVDPDTDLDSLITRENAAVIADRYVKAFEYKFNCYCDPVEFDDIADVCQTKKNAIDWAVRAGIIAGTDSKFDPKGNISRGQGAKILENLIRTILGVNSAAAKYDRDYFERPHIKVGAFGVHTVFGTEKGFDIIKDLGINLFVSGSALFSTTVRNALFNYADKYGINAFGDGYRAHPHIVGDPNFDVAEQAAEYSYHPSFAGHFIYDEPGTDHFPFLSEFAARYNKAFPRQTACVNLLPMYANAAQLKMGASAAAIEYYDADPALYRKYCQAWFEHSKANYICVDIYPLYGHTGEPETWSTYPNYCESVNQVATVARENNAEFWCYIQTWGWADSMRNPSEAEFRWQSYVVLSYGATGVLLWSIVDQFGGHPSIYDYESGQVSQPLYDDCKAVMWEVRNLSDTFVKYRNLGAYTMNCTDKTPYLYMSGEYKDFAILSETVSEQPLLIGCFEKKEGEGYAFTVVNMTDFKDQAGATFKFKLAQPLDVKLYSKSKFTDLTPDSQGYYQINLETGDGVFVTIG